MSITINLTLFTRKKRKDGTIPIYIRLTENRKSKYRSTGISVKPIEWNSKDQVVRKNHHRHKHFNVDLKKQIREIEEIHDELYKKDRLSMNAILSELSDEVNPRSIIERAKEYKSYLKVEERYWEQRHFTVIINNLTAFIDLKDKNDQIDALDNNWIEDFQNYLQNEVQVNSDGERFGNSSNTVRKKIQRVKGFTDWLLKNNDIESDPFTNLQRVKAEKTNNKAKLTHEQIQAIEELDLEEGSQLWHVRNYFLYSFYNAGIRFGDICTLTWNNIVDGVLQYAMHKTGGQKRIKQLKPMLDILEHYKTGNESKNDYIFPILDKKYIDPMELRGRIGSHNAQVNTILKILAEKAGIEANVSFHVSRHSFANFALNKGMDLYSISKALGHSNIQVTEEYLKDFDEEMLNDSMSKLFRDD